MAHPILPCELISWQQVHGLSRHLAWQLKEAGFQPHRIIAIARGGVVPARLLCDFLGIYQFATLRVEHYTQGAQKQQTAKVVDPLTTTPTGQRLLLVDDVSDSGDTFRVALEHVRRAHPAELRTAVLHHKQISHYTPDYFAARVIRWRWLIYPWAAIEDLSGFVQRMTMRPRSPVALAKRLQQDYGITVPSETLADVLSFLGSE